METIAPAAAWHLAAGEGINDHDLVFLDHVFHILLIKTIGLKELGDIMNSLGLRVAMLLAGGFFS